MENLGGKVSFEIWAATVGVNIEIYQSKNGRFSETTFQIKNSGCQPDYNILKEI